MGSFSLDVMKYSSHQIPLALPVLEPSILGPLFLQAEKIFKSEPVLLQVSSPCIIVGDLHGQILDLFRILNSFGLPSRQRYVFLGDLVDRGEFSIETLVVVLLLKVIWADNVFIIRGNHEFSFLCSQCGFMTQMFETYGDLHTYQAAIQMFGYLPLAARIDEHILCVHGGIGPEVTDIDVIATIVRPIESFGQEALDSLVWSDPSDSITEFEASSTRGTGYNFGAEAVRRFLAESGLQTIVRAHECVSEGWQSHFSDAVYTVFSASNYCGLVGNESAVLEVLTSSLIKPRTFPPLPWLFRKDVAFTSTHPGFLKQPQSKAVLKMSPSVRKGLLPISNSLRGLPRLGDSPLAPDPGRDDQAQMTLGMAVMKAAETKRRRATLL
jgi:protein phosphatase